MNDKTASVFTSGDLSPVVTLWQKHLQQYNDRLTITPKDSAGVLAFLTRPKQLQAQIFRAADGGAMVNITYRQRRAMNELLAEHGVALPPTSTMVVKGSNGGPDLQVGVVRVPPQVPVETILSFILQSLAALSGRPIGDSFQAQIDRMRTDRQIHT